MIEHDKFFIGGDYVAPTTDAVFEVISPHSEELVGRVPEGAVGDIDAAVVAARGAFAVWSEMAPSERAAGLRRLAAEFRLRADQIADAQRIEMGIPSSLVRPLMVDPAADVYDYYADLVDETSFEETRVSGGSSSTVRHLPLGVVAAIIPWNGPPFLAAMKIAPALAAGCSVVLKPAPEAPLDGYVLAEAVMAADLPPGLINVVAADRQVGEYLVTHPGVAKVSFTGSQAAGRRIGALCGELLRPVTLELGGKSAAIVLDDADVATTIAGLATNCFLNSGQVCAADTRVLLPRSRYDEFADAFVAMVEQLKVGDPADPETYIGPLVAERQMLKVNEYIRVGVAEGATIATGGGRPADQPTGWYVEPTVFTNVKPDMRIAQEEIFGPVVVLLSYEDDAEAVAIANDSEYGLGGSFWTTDHARATALSRKVETGMIAINAYGNQMNTPFGGFKGSGVGREFGPEGLSAYLQTQSVLNAV